MNEQAPAYHQAELRYAAVHRCRCGAGLAYVINNNSEPGRNWNCSKLLTSDVKFRVKEEGNPLFGVGVLEDQFGELHDGPRPFISWEIKSEIQPSANGTTTRPS